MPLPPLPVGTTSQAVRRARRLQKQWRRYLVELRTEKVTLEIEDKPAFALTGRGPIHIATIKELAPQEGQRSGCTMNELHQRLVGLEVEGLGTIKGVEMFCINQRPGMTVGLLIYGRKTVRD